MKRIKIVGLCLVAVFAFTAVAAASASAEEPTYKACVKAAKNAEKKYTGGYNDKACSEVNSAGEGKYAAEEVVTPLEFTGKSKKSVIYLTKEGKLVWKLVCTKDKETATIEGPEFMSTKITFEKCSVTNETSKVTTKCSTSLTQSGNGILGKTLPAEQSGIVFAIGLESTLECGSFKLEKLFAFAGGPIENTSKGATVDLAVNPSTFEGEVSEFFAFGEPFPLSVSATVNGEGLQGGEETIEAVGPKKPLVVIIP